MIPDHVADIVASGGSAGGVVVVGASANRDKYGNMIVRKFLENGFDVFPVNPREDEIEGLRVIRRPADAGDPVAMVSFVTPPAVTLDVLREMDEARFKVVWFQPGAFDDEVVGYAAGKFETVISDACVLVVLGRLGKSTT